MFYSENWNITHPSVLFRKFKKRHTRMFYSKKKTTQRNVVVQIVIRISRISRKAIPGTHVPGLRKRVSGIHYNPVCHSFFSFIYSFIHWFIHSFIHYSFIQSFIYLLIHSFIHQGPTCEFWFGRMQQESHTTLLHATELVRLCGVKLCCVTLRGVKLCCVNVCCVKLCGVRQCCVGRGSDPGMGGNEWMN